ncbi:sugar phosphate isomerase/epimerase family protein [Caenimonas koreensis]|uniref:sugar phosphate isomerase/epimerase family protein n=1 Tax=Caenimonas koreensis TaxID=367474 RepID=UPI003783A723
MKFALCNEVLQPMPFAQQCEFAAQLGYDGLEVAPFTLAADPMQITDAQAREFAQVAQDHGLRIFGLHWLLVAPAGLSIVSDDTSVRDRTVGVMSRLIELCALMGGNYLVHGSPKQRSAPAGCTREEALARATDCFAKAGAAAASAGVVYCIEPLSINSPGLKTMVDCSAAGQVEKQPVHELMARWMPSGHIAHVQVNDPNRRGPGQGSMQFTPILQTIARMHAQGHYEGIVAVEPFDYVPDGPACAAHSIGYLKGIMESLAYHDAHA